MFNENTSILSKELMLEEDGFKYLGEFQIVSLIGEGTFGKVLLGIHRSTQEKVAIKLLSKSKIKETKDKVRLDREIAILKKMNHINVVKFYYMIETNKTICLVLEYCSGKDLLSYLKGKIRLSEVEASSIFAQIIAAIEYLSLHNIAHRDIKLENILIHDGNVKIIDFGLSNFYESQKSRLLSTSCGSPSYAAPELIIGERYDGTKADIWSCGIVLYALVSGYLPFEASDENSLYEKIIKCEFTISGLLSLDLRDIIKKILVNNPEKRISIQEIKKHSWINMFTISYIKGIIPGMCPPIDYEVVEFIISSKSNSYSINVLVSELINDHKTELTALFYLLVKRKIKSKIIFQGFKSNINSFQTQLLSAKSERDKYQTQLSKSNINFKTSDSINDFDSELFKDYYLHSLKVKVNIDSLINYHITQLTAKSKNITKSVLIKPDDSISYKEIENSAVTNKSLRPLKQDNNQQRIKLLSIWFVNNLLSEIISKKQKQRIKIDLMLTKPTIPALSVNFHRTLNKPKKSESYVSTTVNIENKNFHRIAYIKPICNSASIKINPVINNDARKKYTVQSSSVVRSKAKSIEKLTNLKSDTNKIYHNHSNSIDKNSNKFVVIRAFSPPQALTLTDKFIDVALERKSILVKSPKVNPNQYLDVKVQPQISTKAKSGKYSLGFEFFLKETKNKIIVKK